MGVGETEGEDVICKGQMKGDLIERFWRKLLKAQHLLERLYRFQSTAELSVVTQGTDTGRQLTRVSHRPSIIGRVGNLTLLSGTLNPVLPPHSHLKEQTTHWLYVVDRKYHNSPF